MTIVMGGAWAVAKKSVGRVPGECLKNYSVNQQTVQINHSKGCTTQKITVGALLQMAVKVSSVESVASPG